MASLDWLVVLAVFRLARGPHLVGGPEEQGHHRRLFPRRPRPRLARSSGASIFASNIGSEHLVGLAGSGATSGVALAHYELHAWCLLVLGWVFVPFYMRSRVYTMPEFLERRFSPASRWVLSIISLVAYVLTKIAVGIFAGGVVFGTLMPGGAGAASAAPSSTASGLARCRRRSSPVLYTVIGGMRAVAYTEALQTLILIIGSLLLTMFGLSRAGWVGRAAGGARPGDVQSVEAARFRPASRAPGRRSRNPAGWPGTSTPTSRGSGMLFCAPIIGLWYWCTDQYIVQRTLGAPSETEARRGTIFAAFLKLLPVFIFIIPGMIALALAKSGRCPGLCDDGGPDGRAIARRGAGGVPAAGPAGPAGRDSRHGRGRPAGRAHELAGRRVQRLLDAVHDRPVSEVPAAGDTGSSSCGWAASRPPSWS